MSKAKIEIYTTENCPYCVRAKMLFERKKVDYTEIHVDQDPQKREEMIKRSHGKRTVPQIFINDESIGGFDELWELDKQQKLDEMLKR